MKKRKQDFVLGLTAIVLFALFLATFLFLVQSTGRATRPIVVHFRHEAGLSPLKAGSQVLLSGAIEVGQVTDVEVREIEIDAAGGPRRHTVVVAKAEIDEKLPLYGDCEITTDMPLIGGSGTMVIINVGTPGVPLPPDHIEGLPPQGLAAFSTLSRRLTAEGGIVDRLDRMLDPDAEGSLLNKVMLSLMDINAMTAELRTQLTPAERETLLSKVHLIMDDLNATTGAIRGQVEAENGAGLLAKFHATLDLVHSDLAEVLAMLQEDRPLLRDTLVSVEHAARVVDEELIANLQVEFDPANPQSLLGKLHASMDRVNAALADLQVVSEAGKRLVVVNRPQIERILANVEEMSEALTQASKDIQRNPAKLLRGPSKTQESQLGVLTAAHDFAQAAADMDTAAARLQAILELQPDGGRVPEADVEMRAVYDALRSAFEKFERAEAFFWDEIK